MADTADQTAPKGDNAPEPEDKPKTEATAEVAAPKAEEKPAPKAADEKAEDAKPEPKSAAKEATADQQKSSTADKVAAKAAKPKDDKEAPEAAKKAKKEKPLAPEEKPFQEFMSEHFVPGLRDSLMNEGLADIDVTFEKKPIPIKGFEQSDCWQVQGKWQGGQRQFLVAFQQENIKGPKFYAAADNGSNPTLLESFMIDEKRPSQVLMTMYVRQRLNAQKWLTGN